MSSLHRVTFLLLFSFATCFSQISVLKPAVARNGMVSSADSIASAVGIQMMKAGGNAIDAAVAMGFVLAVTYPQAGNLGGGGYYIIHLNDGRNYAIDARETAPSHASRDMFLDSSGNVNNTEELIGGLSVGVPGNVDGLLIAEKRFGKLPLKEVMRPAIALAAKGFRIGAALADEFKVKEKELSRFPSTMKYFLHNGEIYRAGELFVQKDLARVLTRISKEGRNGFYTGTVPQLIAKEDRATGGIISARDVEEYHAQVKSPISVNYRGYDVISMPPSSSGGVCLAEELNILNNFDLERYGYGASQSLHYELEAMRRAFADRDEYLGDVNYVYVPLERLLSKEYARSVALRIDPFSATPSIDIYPHLIHPPHEGTHTTHYSVVDGAGNAVSVTTTLNSYFGSMVAVNGAGFLLNNEMDDFSAKPGTPNQFGAIGASANSIQPGKRMLSSMAPTIVLKGGRPFLILGSPGGTTIINSVLQVILNVIDYHMPLARAVMAPRVQMQWVPDVVEYENGALVYDVMENLRSRGYRLRPREYIGEVEAILVTPMGFEGVADPRGPGDAEGY